jgi:phage baseplate assembly protein W
MALQTGDTYSFLAAETVAHLYHSLLSHAGHLYSVGGSRDGSSTDRQVRALRSGQSAWQNVGGLLAFDDGSISRRPAAWVRSASTLSVLRAGPVSSQSTGPVVESATINGDGTLAASWTVHVGSYAALGRTALDFVDTGAAGGGSGGFGYWLGVGVESGVKRGVYLYRAGVFERTTDLPTELVRPGACVVGDRLYVIAERFPNDAPSAGTYVADINPATGALGAWTKLAYPATGARRLQSGNNRPCVASINGWLYAFNGFGNLTSQDSSSMVGELFAAKLNADGTIGTWFRANLPQMDKGTYDGMAMAAHGSSLVFSGGAYWQPHPDLGPGSEEIGDSLVLPVLSVSPDETAAADAAPKPGTGTLEVQGEWTQPTQTFHVKVSQGLHDSQTGAGVVHLSSDGGASYGAGVSLGPNFVFSLPDSFASVRLVPGPAGTNWLVQSEVLTVTATQVILAGPPPITIVDVPRAVTPGQGGRSAFGGDLLCLDGLDGAMVPVDGLPMLGDALARRLMTPRGSLVFHPDYGIDLRAWLSRRLTPAALARLRSEVEDELRQDERVLEVDATVEFQQATWSLIIHASVVTADGPFPLTFVVTELGVQLTTLL